MDKEKLINDLKELDDTEFEIVFVDKVTKKVKDALCMDVKSPTLLLVYMGIVDTLRSYELLATEINRQIHHKEVIDLVISKGDSFLSSVASEETNYMYVAKSLSEIQDILKDLMLLLKSNLLQKEEYAHLKQGCSYK